MDRRYKLNVGLQLPPGSKGKFLPAGTEADEPELAGLDTDSLVKGGFLEEIAQPILCPACVDAPAGEGTAASRKKKYADILELREHYMKDHPALAAPATIQEV